MTRLALAALLLSATAATAHDHWSDLDGDGLLEPNEFGLEDPTFIELDRNGDGVVTSAEYEAMMLYRAGELEELAIPDAVRRAAPARGSSGFVPTEPYEPKVIRILP